MQQDAHSGTHPSSIVRNRTNCCKLNTLSPLTFDKMQEECTRMGSTPPEGMTQCTLNFNTGIRNSKNCLKYSSLVTYILSTVFSYLQQSSTDYQVPPTQVF